MGASGSVDVPANWPPVHGRRHVWQRLSHGPLHRPHRSGSHFLRRLGQPDTDAGGATLASYTHTAAGHIATHVVGAAGGIVTGTYAYNPREWVTGIDYPGKFTVTQQYDPVGNVTAQRYHRAETETPKAAAYTYDNLHRLTGFDLDGGASTQAYEYDRNGNITRMTTNGNATHYSYSRTSNPNRLNSVFGAGPSTDFSYNENGWMTAMGTSALTYDYRGLVTGHGSAGYLMDPDRRRVRKMVGTAVTYYLRGADGSVLAEYDGSQVLTARYVYAGSRRIARVAADGGQSYYLADHLGSTRSLVDGGGTVTAVYDYWPYGKVLSSSGTGATRFRFTGHERDAESSLDYMLERSYAYDMGRFLRPDPMQEEYPAISPYAYAANNPLKYVDPDGNRHHEVRASPEAYLAIHAEAIVDHISNDVGESVRDTAELALDVTRKAIEETIVLSDATSEIAYVGTNAGLVVAGAGVVTANPPLLIGSGKVLAASSALGTAADLSKTGALTADYLFFDGSGQAAAEQVLTTITNFGFGRYVKRIQTNLKQYVF